MIEYKGYLIEGEYTIFKIYKDGKYITTVTLLSEAFEVIDGLEVQND